MAFGTTVKRPLHSAASAGRIKPQGSKLKMGKSGGEKAMFSPGMRKAGKNPKRYCNPGMC